MANVSGLIEGAMLIGGQSEGVAISVPHGRVVCKSSPINVVHSGYQGSVYGDVVISPEEMAGGDGEFYPTPDGGWISVTGYGSSIYAGNGVRASALGDESEVNLDYITQPAEGMRDISACHAFTSGYSSRINASENVKTSMLVATGDQSTINALDTTDNVAFVAGANSQVYLGSDSVLFAAQSPFFVLGENGAAAIAWHDGNRKRITVVYAGENGIEAGVDYYLDEHGQVVQA